MLRKCGTCSACCRWPSVAEISKPARVACKNLVRTSKTSFCQIYKERPETCSAYHCTWIRGIGAKCDQPDISNILIDRRSTQFGVVLVAKSLVDGAVMSRNGKLTIQRATRDSGLPCLVIDDDENIIGAAGPDDFMEVVMQKGREGKLQLGGKKDWITNIVAMAQGGKVFPGLDHGG